MVRSERQNKYYFKCIVLPIAKYCGYHKFEMHEILKQRFIIEKSKELDKKEFNDYCEQIRIWAFTELGVNLPLPNECK
jgi:hypothetical protein